MAQGVLARLRAVLKPLRNIGLFGLIMLLATILIIITAMRRATRSNTSAIVMATISRVMKAAGYSEQMVRYWTAVSAFETAYWTSAIFKRANNLWGMTLASRNTTATGRLEDVPEKQAVYPSIEASAQDIVLYQQKRFRYAMNYATLKDLIQAMHRRNYFTSDFNQYLAGVESVYKQLYGKEN